MFSESDGGRQWFNSTFNEREFNHWRPPSDFFNSALVNDASYFTCVTYKLLSEIGKGGMGEVFLARDTKLDRKVALKILPPEFADDKDRMSRFVREAKSAGDF